MTAGTSNPVLQAAPTERRLGLRSPVMPNDKVDLPFEQARAEDLIAKIFAESHVPLPVAAAITFHQVHRNTKAIISRDDYDDALNIAAVALSRLITLFCLVDPREGRTPVVADLTKQHFARGATELRCHDGQPTVRDLSVKRSDMLSAISLIKRIGLPFSFAITAVQDTGTPVGEEDEKPADPSGSDFNISS
jgi:hypothetical protein